MLEVIDIPTAELSLDFLSISSFPIESLTSERSNHDTKINDKNVPEDELCETSTFLSSVTLPLSHKPTIQDTETVGPPIPANLTSSEVNTTQTITDEKHSDKTKRLEPANRYQDSQAQPTSAEASNAQCHIQEDSKTVNVRCYEDASVYSQDDTLPRSLSRNEQRITEIKGFIAHLRTIMGDLEGRVGNRARKLRRVVGNLLRTFEREDCRIGEGEEKQSIESHISKYDIKPRKSITLTDVSIPVGPNDETYDNIDNALYLLTSPAGFPRRRSSLGWKTTWPGIILTSYGIPDLDNIQYCTTNFEEYAMDEFERRKKIEMRLRRYGHVSTKSWEKLGETLRAEREKLFERPPGPPKMARSSASPKSFRNLPTLPTRPPEDNEVRTTDKSSMHHTPQNQLWRTRPSTKPKTPQSLPTLRSKFIEHLPENQILLHHAHTKSPHPSSGTVYVSPAGEQCLTSITPPIPPKNPKRLTIKTSETEALYKSPHADARTKPATEISTSASTLDFISETQSQNRNQNQNQWLKDPSTATATTTFLSSSSSSLPTTPTTPQTRSEIHLWLHRHIPNSLISPKSPNRRTSPSSSNLLAQLETSLSPSPSPPSSNTRTP
ncbi:MAG: hypothetical protein M1834_000081 [Cirrosporium novae-zelandiae]|nr:MAG: hypothetical protein M1834_000081 [Cirrosporium novae-zelandiae]